MVDLDVLRGTRLGDEKYTDIISALNINSLNDITKIITYAGLWEKRYFQLLKGELENKDFVTVNGAISKIYYGPGFCEKAEDYHLRTLFLSEEERNGFKPYYDDSNMGKDFYNMMAAIVSNGQMIGYAKFAGNHTFIATRNIVNETGKIIMPKYSLGWITGDNLSSKIERIFSSYKDEISIIKINNETPFEVGFSRFFDTINMNPHLWGEDIGCKEIEQRICVIMNEVEKGYAENKYKVN